MRLWHFDYAGRGEKLILQDGEEFIIFERLYIMQYEVGLYVSGILRLIGSMPNGEIFFYDLLFMELFTSFFYTFLVDCRYELLIDLCCLMPLWKAVLCIFLYFLYFISPRMLPDVA